MSTNGQYGFVLGTQESALWNPGAGTGDNPSIAYSYDEKRVIVLLQCSTTGMEEFEILGESPTNMYTFRLTHKCACWDGCSSKEILKKNICFDYLGYRWIPNNNHNHCSTDH